MRYVQYKRHGSEPLELGAQIKGGQAVIELSAVDRTIPKNLIEFIPHETEARVKVQRLVQEQKSVLPLSQVDILAPLQNPGKVLALCLNYRDHCHEHGVKYPEYPVFFSKFPSCIVGPYDNIVIPEVSKCVDWEVELVAIIGKQTKNIEANQVEDHLFGYTIAQDISARDWQHRNGGQFLLGKTMDTFCPLGPVAVTKDELPNVYQLQIGCSVNGVKKQQKKIEDMIFKIDYLVSYLSKLMTLYPGDIILTGTPGGVGVRRNPPEFLKHGDILESEIEDIGRLRNVVV